MATVSKFTRGAVAGNGWTNAGNTTGDDGSYATAAPSKNGTITGDWDFAAFSDAEIPVGSTINSVTAEVQWKVSTTSSVATFGVRGVLGGAAQTETTVATEPTTDTITTRTFDTAVPTELNLKTAGDVVVRCRGTRGNSNTAVTFSLDYAKITVDYTVPANVTVTPGTAALVLATFAAVVTATANVTVTPSTASLTTSAFAPTVSASDHKTVVPTTAALTITTFAPTVTGGSGTTVTPGTASLTTEAFTPTVSITDHQIVTPSTASLSVMTFAPAVSITENVATASGTLLWS